ncbi:MAG TPA: ribonuclease HIII [Erysipelotrichaceae bacterium]|nr:ribonuclease HIII [Erysipelotrichaceae bacterium]
MSKETVSFAISKEQVDEIIEYYQTYQRLNDGEYIVFQAIFNQVVITIYENKKGNHKATFIGQEASSEALKWKEDIEIKTIEKATGGKPDWLCYANQIGSDEVGVGDFVLPLIVVAAFVRGKDIKILDQYGVNDSKKISDEKIKEMVPPLLKVFSVSKLTLSNDHYNKVIAKGENLNSVKAKMHNRALLNMFKKFPDTKHIFIDQFVGESKYFSYLNDPQEPKVLNVTFKTKGETYYPCVALASIVARYAFLVEKEKLEKKYQMAFPFGAGKTADDFAKRFIAKFGEKEFAKICKQNFANYKNLKENE